MVDGHRVRKAGDIVWIYPDQHPLHRYPRGFALFLSIVHGALEPRNPYTDKLLTTGFIFDEDAGDWLPEPVTLTISRRQPLARWGEAVPEQDEVTVQPQIGELPDFVERGGRQYARVKVP